MTRLTQTERVRRAGVKAGPRGITQADFLAPNVIDGGRPITRLAARVKDCERLGWPFVAIGKRDECRVYCLKKFLSVPEPEAVAVAKPTDSPVRHLAPPAAAATTSAPGSDHLSEGAGPGLFPAGEFVEQPRPLDAIHDDYQDAA